METSYEPLYQKIYNDIREKIKSGALPLGTKVPTDFELMEQYSVSRITTARALKELANDGIAGSSGRAPPGGSGPLGGL